MESNNDLLNNGFDKFDCPNSLIKLKQKLAHTREHIAIYRREINNLHTEMKLCETMLDRYLSKIAKQNSEKSANKRPSGFAAPVHISDELCDFMGKDKGVLIPRTEVTKYINRYIKDNKLHDEHDKTIIKPNDTLHKLLGTTDNDTVKYFNIQKFLNRHFKK
jgi:chromatin remodeling complex protein RSC6